MNKLYEILKGRYGVDELYRFSIIIVFILIIINLYIKSYIIELIEFIILVISFLRIFSKNKERRRKENNIYLSYKNKIIKYLDYQKRKYNDRNTHMYKKCPSCKQKIRLPLKKGNHKVKCPKCKNTFEVKCNRNEKIKVEIVK